MIVAEQTAQALAAFDVGRVLAHYEVSPWRVPRYVPSAANSNAAPATTGMMARSSCLPWPQRHVKDERDAIPARSVSSYQPVRYLRSTY